MFGTACLVIFEQGKCNLAGISKVLPTAFSRIRITRCEVAACDFMRATFRSTISRCPGSMPAGSQQSVIICDLLISIDILQSQRATPSCHACIKVLYFLRSSPRHSSGCCDIASALQLPKCLRQASQSLCETELLTFKKAWASGSRSIKLIDASSPSKTRSFKGFGKLCRMFVCCGCKKNCPKSHSLKSSSIPRPDFPCLSATQPISRLDFV